MAVLKKNNNGYTIIEVLMVIAIIAISGALVITSVSQITNSEARKAIEEVGALYSETRVLTLSGNDVTLQVSVHDTATGSFEGNSSYGSIIDEDGNVLKDERIGNSSLLLEAVQNDGTVFDIADGSMLQLTFDRTGAIDKVTVGGTLVTEIEIIRATGDGSTYSITIEPATGHHEVSG